MPRNGTENQEGDKKKKKKKTIANSNIQSPSRTLSGKNLKTK